MAAIAVARSIRSAETRRCDVRDLRGIHVVVTGVIEGESRRSAEERLSAAGAIVQSSVGTTTELLVTGARVGKRKLEAAQAKGVAVVPWEAVWNGSASADAWEEVMQPAEEGDPSAPVTRRRYSPMLCKADELPKGDGWSFEVKWDGYRCLAYVDDGHVEMISRSAKSNYVDTFPQVARQLAEWPNVVLDGELVDLGAQSAAMTSVKKTGASYVVYDVLEVEGNDVRQLTFEQRRQILTDVLGAMFDDGDRIALSPVFDDGQALMDEVEERKLEGVVAKRLTSRYVDGNRGWVKVKRRNQQEFVVLGWVPGKGALEGTIGGLVLGVRENDEWVYVGRVGSGPTVNERLELHETLTSLECGGIGHVGGKMTSAEQKDVRWVDPELVVDVAFQKWSPDGRLVIPSLKGLRSDKDALDVTREA